MVHVDHAYVDDGTVKCLLKVVRQAWITVVLDCPGIMLRQPLELRRSIIELNKQDDYLEMIVCGQLRWVRVQ